MNKYLTQQKFYSIQMSFIWAQGFQLWMRKHSFDEGLQDWNGKLLIFGSFFPFGLEGNAVFKHYIGSKCFWVFFVCLMFYQAAMSVDDIISTESVYMLFSFKEACLNSQITIITYVWNWMNMIKKAVSGCFFTAVEGPLSDLLLGTHLYVIFFHHFCLHAAKLLVDETMHIMMGVFTPS